MLFSRRFFNRNLRFYLLFVFVLTWHIFERFGGQSIRPPEGGTIPLIFGFYVFFAVVMVRNAWKVEVLKSM
jgi:hypothetical protein